MFGILLSCLCFASYKYSHHSIIIATYFGHTFSATTSFQFVSGQVCIMAITRAGAITAAAKVVSKSRENEKRRKSAARARKWCERQSAERRSEIQQTNRTGHAEGHACLSEERQSEIRQTNWTGHAEGRARLLEERNAERRSHHDMDVVDEEKDSCDNCHRRDFSVDPRYKLTFTVVSNEEMRTCKLAKVKPRQVHDPVIFFTLCQECERCLKKTPDFLSMTSSQKAHMFDWENIWPLFLWDILSGCNASDNVPYHRIEVAETLWRMICASSMREYWFEVSGVIQYHYHGNFINLDWGNQVLKIKNFLSFYNIP
jgi:hypothetical protein